MVNSCDKFTFLPFLSNGINNHSLLLFILHFSLKPSSSVYNPYPLLYLLITLFYHPQFSPAIPDSQPVFTILINSIASLSPLYLLIFPNFTNFSFSPEFFLNLSLECSSGIPLEFSWGRFLSSDFVF